MLLALIPLLPLIAFAILILIGRRLRKFSAALSLACLFGSLVFSLKAFQILRESGEVLRFRFPWASLGGNPLRLGFQADPLAVTMCLVVTIVGWLILFYSIGYMAPPPAPGPLGQPPKAVPSPTTGAGGGVGQDPRFSRFFAYMSLFCALMLTLVLADNFLLLYIGWEGVGLCSYLLISFWFERPAAAHAGKKAFLTTRIGDLGLLAAILIIVKLTGELGFADLSRKALALGPWAFPVALLIFWGAVGKSAQFPLHVWLPDAMEGPTPVSALIHAATMVAAGVYLVARTLPLFLPNPEAMLLVAGIGAATSFFAATIACTQTDLKRILAYSTISQLGLMMVGLGSGSTYAGIFHLVTHAWFKALLFLAAGSVIHALSHQEITRMGGLAKSMPVTTLAFLVGTVAMAGIPPLAGFWSKEELLLAAAGVSHSGFPHLGKILVAAILCISFLTAFYITRAMGLTFLGKAREATAHHESPLVMTGPLVALSGGAIGVGFLGKDLLARWFSLEAPEGAVCHEGHLWLLWASLTVAISGIVLSLLRYGAGIPLAPVVLRRFFQPIYRLVANKYYVDEAYDLLFIRPTLALARRSFAFDLGVIDGLVNRTGLAGLTVSRLKGWFDQHIVDGIVNGLAATFGRAGATLRLIQTGLVQNYLLIAASGAVALYLFLRGIP